MSHWRDFMDKRSSVRVSAPAYSSRCPTGAREFSELFIMRWTMIRNSERKSDVMVMDSMENVVKRSIGGSETTVGMKYEPPSQGQEKIKEISSLVADKNDEDNENDPYDGLYRWKVGKNERSGNDRRPNKQDDSRKNMNVRAGKTRELDIVAVVVVVESSFVVKLLFVIT
ncbi:hypothetical protein Tco_0257707 [Tanacetum coccineum]